MGSKAQAKASSAWAAKAKKDGKPFRTSTNCPLGCGAKVGLPYTGAGHTCKPKRKF
jgi:hypothetical protein